MASDLQQSSLDVEHPQSPGLEVVGSRRRAFCLGVSAGFAFAGLAVLAFFHKDALGPNQGAKFIGVVPRMPSKPYHAAYMPRPAGIGERPSPSVQMQFRWPWEPNTREHKEAVTQAPKVPKIVADGQGAKASRDVVKLKAIGRSSVDKALEVNLDTGIYGSFAEIGAGQEVSRTFLQAGAAAGTVAKSLSAYDMQMSNALYGSAARYVTEERVMQMMEGEYKDLEAYVREGKDDVRFFSFAATLAAKAYMSDRECEGWVGVQYQHKVGAEPSTVVMHVRMSDPTAKQQGEAIGVLGTNLIYLIKNTNDPYVIAQFLQDGLQVGRLEVDLLKFDGPGFPKGSYDTRFLALSMVDSRLTPMVLLEPDENGNYQQAVPNNAFYKTPLIVQKSRFLPVTYMHEELMASSYKQICSEVDEGGRPPKCLYDMRVDDLLRPAKLTSPLGRVQRTVTLLKADSDKDGRLTRDELRGILAGNKKKTLSTEEIEELVSGVDPENQGFVDIDVLQGFSREACSSQVYLDRMDMLQTLRAPVCISSIKQNYDLAEYLTRYTKEQVTIVVGGGGYSFEKGLYNPLGYAKLDGGMLEGFGRLFAKNVKILEYPNILPDGEVVKNAHPEGPKEDLHEFLVRTGNIRETADEHIIASAKDPTTNQAFRARATDVAQKIQDGDPSWETYVSPKVADIVKARVSEKLVQPEAYAINRFRENIP